MSSKKYDVIVIGVGGIGSATTYQLARRGVDVLGLERFDIPHEQGSSHGYTRIFRMAYNEQPAYVPMLQRARELWRQLEDERGRKLLHTTGSVHAGPEGSDVVEGALRSVDEHSLEHDVLSGAELSKRFPGYDLPDSHRAIYQPDGGFLEPEQCIIAHVERTFAHGGTIHAREAVTDWRTTANGVEVQTDRDVYRADRLVITAGAWAGKLLPALEEYLDPEQRVLAWFQPDERDRFTTERFPVFIAEVEDERYYGFPVFNVPGFKVGRYGHPPSTVDPDDLGDPTDSERTALRQFASQHFAGAAGPTMGVKTCLATYSGDDHFVMDFHPEHPEVVVGAGFSGHGFKLASAIGEILADLATDGETGHDIDMFGADRFL